MPRNRIMATKRGLRAETLAVLMFVSSIAQAATIYVPGDYAAISNAIKAAASGDTIEVTDSSTYTETPEFKSGTATPLTIRATGLPAATVNGMFLWSASDKTTTIEGFTIQNSGGWGIAVGTDATKNNINLTFRNVTIASGASMGIYSKPLTNCVLNLIDCSLNGGGSFNINVEGSANTANNQLNLTRCVVKDATVVNVQIGSPGFAVNMTDCEVSGSGMYGINTQGTGDTSNNRLNMTRCVVKGAANVNMQMGSPGFVGTWINCVFAGDPQFNALLQAAGVARFYNCVFADTDTSDSSVLVANDAGVTVGVTNCVIYQGQHGLVRTSGAIIEDYNLFYGQSGISRSNCVEGANTIMGSNPAFANAAGYDFHLTAGSPAIDEGVNLGATVADDYDKNSRPAGGGYDIGAFEYGSSPGGGGPGPEMPDDWATYYFGGTNAPGGGPNEDWDGDGCLNLEEFVAGTDPTNSASFFAVEIGYSNGDILVTFEKIQAAGTGYDGLNRYYNLESLTNPIADAWLPVSANISGDGGVFVHTNLSGGPVGFYRAKARLE